MRPYLSLACLCTSIIVGAVVMVTDVSAQGPRARLLTPDESGILESVSNAPLAVDLANPFFKDLGTNGRACVTCHMPAQAWSISADEVRRRFNATPGMDPVSGPSTVRIRRTRILRQSSRAAVPSACCSPGA